MRHAASSPPRCSTGTSSHAVPKFTSPLPSDAASEFRSQCCAFPLVVAIGYRRAESTADFLPGKAEWGSGSDVPFHEWGCQRREVPSWETTNEGVPEGKGGLVRAKL